MNDAASTRIERLEADVEFLCSAECTGRAPGTPGGHRAARFVESRMEGLGLRPAGEDGFRQPIPPINGASILGALRGPDEGWVLLVAHFDHLGEQADGTHWGANDNAAGVAVMLEVAHTLTDRREPAGRSVLFCSFDAEEPPYFCGPHMGSQWFVDHPTIPLGDIDLMICLDLVGASLGDESIPGEVGESIFVQGAEISSGTMGLIDGLPVVDGIRPRHIPDWLIPPMSDHDAFRTAGIPWIFYTVGRDVRYHTPADTPEHLDYTKMAALVTHLEQLVDTAATSQGKRRYINDPAGDTAVLDSLGSLLGELAAVDTEAAAGLMELERLKGELDDGRLPEDARDGVRAIVFDASRRMPATG